MSVIPVTAKITKRVPTLCFHIFRRSIDYFLTLKNRRKRVISEKERGGSPHKNLATIWKAGTNETRGPLPGDLIEDFQGL